VGEQKAIRKTPRLLCLTQGIDRTDWQWWQKADLLSGPGAGCGLAAQGFTPAAGGSVSPG